MLRLGKLGGPVLVVSPSTLLAGRGLSRSAVVGFGFRSTGVAVDERVFLVLVDWTLVPKRTEIGLRTLLWLPAAVPGLCNCDKRVAVAEAETRGGIEFALSSICPEFNLP